MADRHAATLCAHAGAPRTPEIGAEARSHISPLYQMSVMDFPSIEASQPALGGDGYVYRRNGAPNADELGAAVAALEGAPAGIGTSAGMGAVSAAVLGLCGAGDRLVVQRDAYGGSQALFDRDLARLGIEVVYADAYEPEVFAAALEGARAALVESVSNPLLRCAELPALAAASERAGAALIVDNTFATPLRDRPLEHGAHLVVHSVTKFLGGHHDLLAGAVVGAADAVAAARGVAVRFGLGAAPMDAWLAVRGIRTLEVRMSRAWANAEELAGRLRERVGRVYASERCALLAFDVGSYEAADRVVSAFQMITLSPSLGGVTTTASHPATSSHRALEPEVRRAAGIGDGLLRLSVGIEHVDDIWCDLERALTVAL
jgi:cystathionine beta-lyase/cystathionine gamma-synthase